MTWSTRAGQKGGTQDRGPEQGSPGQGSPWVGGGRTAGIQNPGQRRRPGAGGRTSDFLVKQTRKSLDRSSRENGWVSFITGCKSLTSEFTSL